MEILPVLSISWHPHHHSEWHTYLPCRGSAMYHSHRRVLLVAGSSALVLIALAAVAWLRPSEAGPVPLPRPRPPIDMPRPEPIPQPIPIPNNQAALPDSPAFAHRWPQARPIVPAATLVALPAKIAPDTTPRPQRSRTGSAVCVRHGLRQIWQGRSWRCRR